MRHEEDTLLMQCVSWADMWFNLYHRDLCVKQTDKHGQTRLVAPLMHAASERKATPQAGRRLKSKGQRAGFPDIYFPLFWAGQSGLFIELKTEKGRLSENQKNWAEYLVGDKMSCSNVSYSVCRSLEEFQKSVMEYMS